MQVSLAHLQTTIRSGVPAAVGFLILLLTAVPRPAAASVILQQDPIPNGGGVSSAGSFRSFDDFKLDSATPIIAVRWWEFGTSVRTQNFTISFTDTVDPFFPDATSSLYEATVTATGTLAGSFLYQYEATLPTPALLPGGTNLWLSIVDVTPNADFVWDKASNAASPGALSAGIMASVDASGSPILQGMDVAWALASDPVAVPEPGSLALFATALAGLGVFRRRRCG